MTNWIVLMALTRDLVVTILNVTGMDYQPVQFFASIGTVQLVGSNNSRDLREAIESGPLCITDLFQNKSVAYF